MYEMEVISKMDKYIQNMNMCMNEPKCGMVKGSKSPQGM